MIKAIGAKIYAAWSNRRNRRWINNPEETQEKVLKNLIKQGLKTRFGKDHSFEKIKDFIISNKLDLVLIGRPQPLHHQVLVDCPLQFSQGLGGLLF